MISPRVNGERLVVLAWSRAILLQLAHPLVAAGVAEHSTFREGRLTAALRLHSTVRAMLSLTFGDEAAREATIARINGIHRRVNGRLREDTGPFPAGTPYSAEDPELLLWVHATLLESVPLFYGLIVGPLSERERDAYCREGAPIARALGVTEGIPQTWREVRALIDRMYDSGRITVGREARELGPAVLAPSLSWTLAPARHVNRLFAVGFLPARVREGYGFAWTDSDERALARWVPVVRAARRATPDVLALWPEARRTASRRMGWEIAT